MEITEKFVAESQGDWREWLQRNHETKKEIWLVLYKKGSGKQGLAYEQAVEEALCYGWIDGQMKSIDAESYANRFTPRRPGGNWSAGNTALVQRLIEQGRLTRAGFEALPNELRRT